MQKTVTNTSGVHQDHFFLKVVFIAARGLSQFQDVATGYVFRFSHSSDCFSGRDPVISHRANKWYIFCVFLVKLQNRSDLMLEFFASEAHAFYPEHFRHKMLCVPWKSEGWIGERSFQCKVQHILIWLWAIVIQCNCELLSNFMSCLKSCTQVSELV